jgi:hypothetical protein
MIELTSRVSESGQTLRVERASWVELYISYAREP